MELHGAEEEEEGDIAIDEGKWRVCDDSIVMLDLILFVQRGWRVGRLR